MSFKVLLMSFRAEFRNMMWAGPVQRSVSVPVFRKHCSAQPQQPDFTCRATICGALHQLRIPSFSLEGPSRTGLLLLAPA